MSKLAAEPAEMYELGKPPIPMTVKCLSFLWLSWGKWITQGHREMCETLRARHPWAPVGWTVAYHGNVTGEPWRYCGVNMHAHQIWMDGWSYIYICHLIHWWIDAYTESHGNDLFILKVESARSWRIPIGWLRKSLPNAWWMVDVGELFSFRSFTGGLLQFFLGQLSVLTIQ